MPYFWCKYGPYIDNNEPERISPIKILIKEPPYPDTLIINRSSSY